MGRIATAQAPGPDRCPAETSFPDRARAVRSTGRPAYPAAVDRAVAGTAVGAATNAVAR